MNEPLRKNLLKDQVGEKKLQRGKSADVCTKEHKTEIKVLGRKLPPSQRGERENRGIPRLEGRRKKARGKIRAFDQEKETEAASAVIFFSWHLESTVCWCEKSVEK